MRGRFHITGLMLAFTLGGFAPSAQAADAQEMAAPPAQEMAAPPAQEMAAPPAQEMAAPPAMPVGTVDAEKEDFIQWETAPAYLLEQQGHEELAPGVKALAKALTAAAQDPVIETAAADAPPTDTLAADAPAADAPVADASAADASVDAGTAPEEEAASADIPPVPVAPLKKIAPQKAGVMLPQPRPLIPGVTLPEDAEIPIVDTDETQPLPPYPPQARTAIGKQKTYNMGEEDTLLDVARYYRLGFVELRAANPKVDSWTPVPGEEVVIPTFKLLPRAEQAGIVVNLAQMRMYIFHGPGREPTTFPIGIGREGLQTPVGETTIVRKVAGPTWFPTDRMRQEKPYLPAAIPPGNQNPLGSHALYLGWPTFLIHGSNKPWAIGRRVSSGCMRLYPEDIKALYNMIPIGAQVTVVDQPILVAWVGDKLYLEVNPSKSQSIDIEINGEHEAKDLTPATRKVITAAAGIAKSRIDWTVVERAMDERRGVPVVIATRGAADEETAQADKDDTDVETAADAETADVKPPVKKFDQPKYN